MDALVERDLRQFRRNSKVKKKTQRWRWICVIFFLEKLFQQQHLLLNRLVLLKEKKSRHKNKQKRPMPSTFFLLEAPTLVFVGRQVFVGSFKACITLSMQHGRLNSAILFSCDRAQERLFFLSQRLCQLFRC